MTRRSVDQLLSDSVAWVTATRKRGTIFVASVVIAGTAAYVGTGGLNPDEPPSEYDKARTYLESLPRLDRGKACAAAGLMTRADAHDYLSEQVPDDVSARRVYDILRPDCRGDG